MKSMFHLCGNLEHVKCMIVGRLSCGIRLLVPPGVHKGNALVMTLLLQPVQVLPEDSPDNGALVVLVNEPHPLGRDFF